MRSPSIVAAALIVLSTTHAVAQTKPKDEARMHFERGLERYGARDYATALAEFSKSYDLGKRSAALMNVAQTQRELGAFAQAYESYARVLDAHEAQLSEEERTRVKTALDEIATVTGTMRIEGEPGSRVTIDGSAVGELPFAAPRRLSSGLHHVVVETPGRSPVVRDVTVSAANESRIDANAIPSSGQQANAPKTKTSSPMNAKDVAEPAIVDEGHPPRRLVLDGALFLPFTAAGAPHGGNTGAESAWDADLGAPIGVGGVAHLGRDLNRALSVFGTAAFAYTHNMDHVTRTNGTGTDMYSHDSYAGFVGAGARLTKPIRGVQLTASASIGGVVRALGLDVSGKNTSFSDGTGYVTPGTMLDAGVLIRLGSNVDLTGGVLAWIDAGNVADGGKVAVNKIEVSSGPNVFVGPMIGIVWGR